MKRRILRVLFLISVLCVALNSSASDEDSEKTGERWEWVEQSEYGFFIRKPVTWGMSEEIEKAEIKWDLQHPAGRAGVLLWSAPFQQEMSRQQLADVCVQQIQASHKGLLAERLPTSRINFFNAGVKAPGFLFREYKGKTNDTAIRTYIGSKTYNGRVYILVGSYPEGDMEREELVRQVILGFRLARPTDSQIAYDLRLVSSSAIARKKATAAPKPDDEKQTVPADDTDANDQPEQPTKQTSELRDPASLIPEDSEVGKEIELDAIVDDGDVMETPDGREYKMAFASYAPTGLDPCEDTTDVWVFVAQSQTIDWIIEMEKPRLPAEPAPLTMGTWGIKASSDSKTVLLFRAANVLVKVSGSADNAAKIAALVQGKLN